LILAQYPGISVNLNGNSILIKVCYIVSLCANFQQQSCSTAISPSNGPWMLVRKVTLQPKILPQCDP